MSKAIVNDPMIEEVLSFPKDRKVITLFGVLHIEFTFCTLASQIVKAIPKRPSSSPYMHVPHLPLLTPKLEKLNPLVTPVQVSIEMNEYPLSYSVIYKGRKVVTTGD
jgi:hypothetical protein